MATPSATFDVAALRRTVRLLLLAHAAARCEGWVAPFSSLLSPSLALAPPFSSSASVAKGARVRLEQARAPGAAAAASSSCCCRCLPPTDRRILRRRRCRAASSSSSALFALDVDETTAAATASATLQALSDGSAEAAAAAATAAAATVVAAAGWWETAAQPALLALVLAAGTDPVVRTLWNATHLNTTKSDLSETVTFSVADSVTTSAKVYLGLLGAQAVLGWVSAGSRPAAAAAAVPELLSPQSALTIAVTVWVALSLSTLKRLVFLQSVSGTSLGRVALYDRLLDFILFLLSTLVILDVLQVDLTSSVQSLFTAGGVGALLFSLASRGLAEQIVGGFILNAWDDMNEGDEVILGDKTEGVVHRIGLVETEILGPDNIITKLPNSQLTALRIQNLSRVKQSRVKQTLRFKYGDLEVLPTVLADMKEEIRRSCPKLVDDGTKGFSCLLQSYEPDHVSACVSCHFNIPPSSKEYSENRQQVLLAIARAMRNHGVEFALPAMTYETTRADQQQQQQQAPRTRAPSSDGDDGEEDVFP